MTIPDWLISVLPPAMTGAAGYGAARLQHRTSSKKQTQDWIVAQIKVQADDIKDLRARVTKLEEHKRILSDYAVVLRTQIETLGADPAPWPPFTHTGPIDIPD